jgi:hypothetical protein
MYIWKIYKPGEVKEVINFELWFVEVILANVQHPPNPIYMLNIVLVEPEIPNNTIGRLCVGTGKSTTPSSSFWVRD